MKFKFIYDDTLSSLIGMETILVFIASFDVFINEDFIGALIGFIIAVLAIIVLKYRIRTTKNMWIILLITNTVMITYSLIILINMFITYYWVTASFTTIIITCIVLPIFAYKELFSRNVKAVYGAYL